MGEQSRNLLVALLGRPAMVVSKSVDLLSPASINYAMIQVINLTMEMNGVIGF